MSPRVPVALVVVGALLLAGCSASTSGIPTLTPSPTPSRTRFMDAADACSVPSVVRDKGASIDLDTRGKNEASGWSYFTVTCLLTKLAAPSYVLAHIDSTRALDGQQTDTWDDVAARWTYHPDSGLRLTLVDERLT